MESKTPLRLSVENVATTLEHIPLDDVGTILYIPKAKLEATKSEFSTDKERLRVLIQYWFDKDPHVSWRRLIIRLDWVSIYDETATAAAANSIRNYAEKLTDPSLTCSSVLAALETVNDVTNGYNAYKKLENCLSIEFEAWKMKMRKQYSSVIEYRKDLVNYWLKYHPNASWKYLAGELLYTECNQALEEVKRNIPRPINDPSLTLTNLTQLMENVKDVLDIEIYLNIPHNSCDYSRNLQTINSKHIEMLSEWYLNNHPAPSWQHIIDGLYHYRQHEALEKLRTLLQRGYSLTLTSLTHLMRFVNDIVQVKLILNIPDDVFDDTYKQHSNNSNNSERKKTLSKWYLNNHPAPSWQHIADGLYRFKEHEALDVLRTHYLRGPLHGVH